MTTQAIQAKLGKSATLNKLLGASHVSMVDAVKHSANAVIHQTIKIHSDHETNNLIAIRQVCHTDADKALTKAQTKCESEYHKQLSGDSTISTFAETYNKCLGSAETVYNSAISTCNTDLTSEMGVLGNVVDNTLGHAFNISA